MDKLKGKRLQVKRALKSLYRRLFLLAFLIFQTTGQAQTYPVQTFVQVVPPYTSYLPDYTDPFSNQLKVLLTLTDFTVPSYQVKLRFTLEGNGYSITTGSLLGIPEIMVTPGVPVEISGADLAPYLNTSNLVFAGIDVADYEMRKVLPEGPCSICVEVIDFSNPTQAVLSNPACAQVWFSLNDPPLLNAPFCGTQITPTDPQQVFFSWAPLHMNSPNSMGTQYTFELFEIRPDAADPNQVVNSTLPIFLQVTDQPFINYGITEPPLQTGMSYAWRVRAQDVEGRDLFRNNGYSTVCTFTYGNIAASLADGITLELQSNGTGVRQGLAWWNASATFTHYQLQVRKTGNPDYEWFPYNATTGDTKINGLEPNTEYECRVKGFVGDDYEGEWSNISVFKTLPAPDYACGSTSLPAKSQVVEPLTNAIAGMYFTVGQFEMLVTDIQPLNVPGHYKGTGKINVEFALMNLRVKFDDILVDENLMVRSGKVEAITEGIDAWLSNLENEVQYVDGTITGFEWNDTTSLTVWIDGVQQEFTFPDNGVIVLQDEEGFKYTFNADGTYSVISILNYIPEQLAATSDYRVDFLADPNQQFGFDKKEHAAWIHHYDVILLSDTSNYFVPFKSIAPGATDQLHAFITADEVLGELSFVASPSGQMLNAERIDDTHYLLTLENLESSAFVYAYDGNNKIGKLWVKVLPEIEKEVVIVPVNGAALSDPTNLQANLNAIYAQANVRYAVSFAANFENMSWDLDSNNQLKHGDPHLMTNYSDEMRALRDAYFAVHPDYNPEAYHLFVINSFEDPELAGYMVRGKGVGFLKNGENAHTAAHELAHGVFALEHTFPEIAEGTTNNLMDYGSGNQLSHHQWMLIQKPLPAFSMFDGEEEGEYSFDEDIPFYKNQKVVTTLAPENVGKGFLLLNGKAYKFKPEDAVSKIGFDKYGRVYTFQVADGTIYKAFIGRTMSGGDPLCLGYLSEADYNQFKATFPGATSFGPAQYDFVKARRYQFLDCPVGDQVFQRTVPYFHNGLSGGEFWIEVNDECLIERTFANEDFAPAANYNESATTGIYIGPSINDAVYTVVDGSCIIDASIAELNEEGPGAPLYFCLKGDAPNGSDLAELANYISDLTANKQYAFYDDIDNKAEYIGVMSSGYQVNIGEVTCAALKREEIFTVANFQAHYPKSKWFYARDADSVIAHVNIRADIPAYYNARSIDYASFETPHVKDWSPANPEPLFDVLDYIEQLLTYQVQLNPALAAEINYQKMVAFILEAREDPYKYLEYKLELRMKIISCLDLLGVYERYEYSLADLVNREEATFMNVIYDNEQQGKAVPINLSDEYSQYVNKYDTECAFFIGFEYLKMYVDMLFEPFAIAQAVSRFQDLAQGYKSFKVQHGGVDDVLKGGNNAMDEVSDMFKPGYSKEDILAIPYGSRPNPSTYLMDHYITEHLSKFDGEVSCLSFENSINSYNQIGRNDGLFVLTKAEMDDLLNRTGGDVSKIEQELGIPSGTWSSRINDPLKPDKLIRIDIQNSSNHNLRMPDGNESGANELWLPGGKTPEGLNEAVIDPIPADATNEYVKIIIAQ